MSELTTYKLGEIAERITSGGTPSTRKKEYYGGEIPWLRTKEINFNRIYDTEIKITEDAVKNSSAKIIDKNSVIVAMYGATAGRIAINKIPLTTNQACCNITINPDKGDYNYVYYLLKSMFGEIFKMATGAAQQNLNAGMLRDLEIQIPDLATQKEIAQILTALDDKIELNLQMNQTLEAMAQAVFKEWFVEFNYPSELGCVGLKDDRILDDKEIQKSTHPKNHNSDNLPKGWKMGKLGEICKVQNGYAFKSKDFSNEGKNGIIKIKSISNNVVDINNMQFVPSEIAETIAERFKVKSGDLLIAMTGAEVGKVGIVPNTEKKLWLNQRVGSFKEKIKYSKWFCYLILSTNEYQNILLSSARGSAQPNISGSQIEKTEIIMPSKELIEKFGKVVNPLFEKIIENYSFNQTLTQTRDALLPRLMSGKISV